MVGFERERSVEDEVGESIYAHAYECRKSVAGESNAPYYEFHVSQHAVVGNDPGDKKLEQIACCEAEAESQGLVITPLWERNTQNLFHTNELTNPAP